MKTYCKIGNRGEKILFYLWHLQNITRNADNSQMISGNPEIIKKCKFCSCSQKGSSCSAYGKLCNKCKKKNHLAKCCNIKKVSRVQKYHDNCKSDEIYRNLCFTKASFVGTVSNEDFAPFDNGDNEWTTILEENKTLINFKNDTGAQTNISFRMFLNLQNRPKLQTQSLDYLLIMEWTQCSS